MICQIIDTIDDTAYTNFLLKESGTLLYQSTNYLNFIKEITQAELKFFTLTSNNDLEAIMPAFIKKTKYGKVLNSLPFYGSNGAVISKNDNKENKQILLDFYKDYIAKNDFVCCTVISSPFERHPELYQAILKPTCNDERIGQLTPLLNTSKEVFDSFHYKTRNSIRKGEKSNIAISCEEGLQYFDFLFETHKENIISIDGTYKDKKVFDLFKQQFKYGTDYKIFVGLIDNKPVSALLNFYFNETVEYYTPVTVREYREMQPLSAIIWYAMQDAICNNYRWWNWGGTWLTQKGVYDFKKRWGTKDLNYKYYVNVFNDQIFEIPRMEILNEFRYFYTVPFNSLKNLNENF